MQYQWASFNPPRLSIRGERLHVERLFSFQSGRQHKLVQEEPTLHAARTPPPPQRGKPNKLTRDTIKFTVNVSREEAESPNHVAHCGETRVENWAGSSSGRGHGGGGVHNREGTHW